MSSLCRVLNKQEKETSEIKVLNVKGLQIDEVIDEISNFHDMLM